MFTYKQGNNYFNDDTPINISPFNIIDVSLHVSDLQCNVIGKLV